MKRLLQIYRHGPTLFEIFGKILNLDIYIVDEKGVVQKATKGSVKQRSIVLYKDQTGHQLVFPNQNKENGLFFSPEDLNRFIRKPSASKSLLKNHVVITDTDDHILMIPTKSYESHLDRIKSKFKPSSSVNIRKKVRFNLKANQVHYI